MMSSKISTLSILGAMTLVFATACGGEEVVASRGAPVSAAAPPAAGGGAGAQTRRSAGGASPAAAPGPEAADRPDRPRIPLTREDFGKESRDPFRNYNEVQNVEISPESPRERQRQVRMVEYNFEDLTLIGIVHSGKNVQPRALWVGTDGKSKTIKQGEYFSRAEVLLATVNRDYVEIEVVDDELAKGLNMERGERRAVYLKQD